jgi:hypothetical protein
MLAAEPQVAQAGRRVLRQGRGRVGSLVIFGFGQQIIELPRVESRAAEIELGFVQFLQLESEQFFLPGSPRH